jgi:glyoxylase-like metal-dependent hydrolase (beta-lactamase superfamily II)
MTYSGHVRPGGPADVRELTELVLTKISVGPMDNNAYLLRCRSTGAQVLVDAANEPARLLDLVGEAGVDAVITTHRHADHWQALDAVVDATGAAVIAHPLDADELPVGVTQYVDDDDVIAVGDSELRVIHVAGHTPGGIVLVYDDPHGHTHLITGDSLFPGGVGRTISGPDFAQLMDDVEYKLFEQYTDEAWVYPGHGRDTTLGTERPHLAEWRDRGW